MANKITKVKILFTVEDAVKLVSFSFPAVPAKLPL
jgi:hypothetical protein